MKDRLKPQLVTRRPPRWAVVGVFLMAASWLVGISLLATASDASSDVAATQNIYWELEEFTADLDHKRITDRWGGDPIEWETFVSPKPPPEFLVEGDSVTVNVSVNYKYGTESGGAGRPKYIRISASVLGESAEERWDLVSNYCRTPIPPDLPPNMPFSGTLSLQATGRLDPPDTAHNTLLISVRVSVVEYCWTGEASGSSTYTARYVRVQGTPPPTPTPTPTPEGIAIEGRVYGPSSSFPLIGVPVALLQDGKLLDQVISQPPNGHFKFPRAPIANNLVISVTLRHEAVSPPAFQVVYDAVFDHVVAYITTWPFATRPDRDPLIKLIPFADMPGIETDAWILRENLGDLAVIYYHTHQAWQLVDFVDQELDAQLPVDVVAYSLQNGVFWKGPWTDGTNAGTAPYINIDVSGSPITDGGRPDNREWHEFGHHVMADTFANLMPKYDYAGERDINHRGYLNPSTTDSWMEGFATFFSLMVSDKVAGVPRPELYKINENWIENLEANHRAWDLKALPSGNFFSLEELAVAGLLWDLVDPVDANDATMLGGVRYSDCVQISFEYLWDLISTNWDQPNVSRSPAAPPGYGYIFDVKQLYDVLKANNVGATRSKGRDIDDLDELFIAHGFFADLNGNRVYDPGEPIGLTGYPTFTLPSGAVVPGRPERRNTEVIPNSYVSFQAVGADTGVAVDAQHINVEVRFAPPFEHYSYSFQHTATRPGRFYFFSPSSQYDVTTHITALGANGYMSTEPLQITGEQHRELLATASEDSFMNHTFVMEQQPLMYLPLVMRGPYAEQFLPAGSWVEAAAPQGAPCLWETPVPTPTATATATPQVPVVESIEPSSAPQGEEVQATVYGYFFQPGAAPYVGFRQLRNVEYLGPEISPPHRWRLRGTVPGDLAPGVYDVTVVNPDGQAGVLRNGFTVTQGPTFTSTPTHTPTAVHTPTPTATHTPTPSPPANVTLDSVTTTDDDSETRMAFVGGDTVRLWMRISNDGTGSVDVQAAWEVRNQAGSSVPAFAWSGELTIEPGSSWWQLARTVPANLASGQYTYTASVTYGDQTQTKSAVLYVADNLLLADDFSDPGSGWPEQSPFPVDYEIGYVDGEYRILVKGEHRIVWVTPGLELENQVLEVDARNVSPELAAYGLLFGLNDDGDSFFAFRVSSNGYYQIAKRTPAGWTYPADWTETSALNQGQATNHLMLVRQGAQIAVYANGVHLTTVSDNSLLSRRVGLVARSFDDPNVEARFDNFRAYEIDSALVTGEVAAQATAQSGASEDTPDFPGNTRR